MKDQRRFFDFLEVIKRAEFGEVMKEADYDKRLGKKALSLMKQYEIHFDPQCVIPSDDALADRIFQAAVDLFLDLGVYCTDTQRVIRFTQEELRWALENVPQEVRYGREKETVSVYPRKVEDKRDPVCFFSAVGTPVTEEMFVPVAQSYAQEPLADTFSGPLITSYKGIPLSLIHI